MDRMIFSELVTKLVTLFCTTNGIKSEFVIIDPEPADVTVITPVGVKPPLLI